MFSIFLIFFQFCGVAQMAVVHKYSKPNFVICLQNLEVLNLKTPFILQAIVAKIFKKKEVL